MRGLHLLGEHGRLVQVLTVVEVGLCRVHLGRVEHLGRKVETLEVVSVRHGERHLLVVVTTLDRVRIHSVVLVRKHLYTNSSDEIKRWAYLRVLLLPLRVLLFPLFRVSLLAVVPGRLLMLLVMSAAVGARCQDLVYAEHAIVRVEEALLGSHASICLV